MIYLDHAATSWPKPQAVLDAWASYHEVAGSPGRGGHRGATEATRRVEVVRRELSELLGASDPSRCLFAPSCTHAINLAIAGSLGAGDHAIATELDHNSVLRPLAALEAKGRIALTIVSADRDGFVRPEAVRAAVRPTTRLIAAPHATNSVGTIQDVAAFGEIAHAARARFLLDAAQTAGLVPIDAPRIGADFVAVPGHKKLLGPSGVGALLVAPEIGLEPDRHGGTGVASDALVPEVRWPSSFEPGTGNPGGIVAWGAGIRVATEDGLAVARERETALLERLEEGLASIRGVTRFGARSTERRVGVAALTVRGLEPDEVAAALDSTFGILVRAGLLCAPRAIEALGAPPSGVVRLSIGVSTTPQEIDAALSALREIAASA
ncbi:MAG TPA: aminotransferase class V-fold PLP-dependent enzyme [Planctomycetota bacterium]|nr:aminotransferase class V-fold PLP-dependent enzyme [Planctomycetota bacterium]